MNDINNRVTLPRERWLEVRSEFPGVVFMNFGGFGDSVVVLASSEEEARRLYNMVQTNPPSRHIYVFRDKLK